MSVWTSVRGIVEVAPMGRTQAEKTYVLETILAHQPRITGSEDDANVKYFTNPGYNETSTHDELGCPYESIEDSQQQTLYTIVITGDLRDREFESAYKDTVAWLCRLAKRVLVRNALVRVSDDCGKSAIIDDDHKLFCEMFERPSWSSPKKDRHRNRFEYLLWDGDGYSGLPLSIVASDYADEEIELELERRKAFFERRASERSMK